jgi:hypothetical protein
LEEKMREQVVMTLGDRERHLDVGWGVQLRRAAGARPASAVDTTEFGAQQSRLEQPVEMVLGSVAVDRELVGDLVHGDGSVSTADELVDGATALVGQDAGVRRRRKGDGRRDIDCRHPADSTGGRPGCKSNEGWL